MYQVGIDIGSSAAKTVVLRDGEIWKTMEMATGFSLFGFFRKRFKIPISHHF